VLACAQPAPGIVSSLLTGMAQEHERGLGNWQAELGQYQSLFEGVHGAAHALAELLEGVRFDAARARANIEAAGGAIFSEALAALLRPSIGREAAHKRVADLCAESAAGGIALQELAARQLPADASLGLDAMQVARVFDIDRAAECAVRQARALLASEPFCASDPGTVN
jgi:3-carboxy-cis,cis-muconate cycloisomerase